MCPDEPQLIKLNCLLSCRLCNPSNDHSGDHCSLWHPLLSQENFQGERIRFRGISLQAHKLFIVSLLAGTLMPLFVLTYLYNCFSRHTPLTSRV